MWDPRRRPSGTFTVPGPHIKGAVLREFLVWYAANGGGERLRATALRLDPTLLAELRIDEPGLGIVVSRWYPATLVHAMLDGLVGDLDPAVRTNVLRSAAIAVANTMVRGIYKLLFVTVATPSLYARHIPRAWRQLHDTGDRSVRLLDAHSAESTIRDWRGHHPVLCELVNEITAILFGLMGLQNVQAQRVACISHGDAECRALLRWEG